MEQDQLKALLETIIMETEKNNITTINEMIHYLVDEMQKA